MVEDIIIMVMIVDIEVMVEDFLVVQVVEEDEECVNNVVDFLIWSTIN